MSASSGSGQSRPNIALLFPPQWSPFQPPMGLPALSGHLKRAGHATRAFDLNVQFYHWLISDEGAALLLHPVDSGEAQASRSDAYNIIRANHAFVGAVQQAQSQDAESVFASHWIMQRALETYCDAASDLVDGAFRITPYTLELNQNQEDRESLERWVESPPPVLLGCAEYYAKLVLNHRPWSIGLSCIGQTQLFFSLLLGPVYSPPYINESLNDFPVFVQKTGIFSFLQRRWRFGRRLASCCY